MCRKKIFFLLTCFTLSQTAVTYTQDNQQDTANSLQNQPSSIPTENLNEFWTQPKYTRESVCSFLTRVYNHRQYGESFLALNFSHVGTFLSYTAESLQPRAYIQMVLDLFGQKLKSTNYINSYAFIELLAKMPELLRKYCQKNADLNKNAEIKDFKDCLCDYLLHNFSNLKENPDQSLSILAEKIYTVAHAPHTDKDISIEELQQSVAQFLEISLSKLIWSPEDNIEVWESVKIVACTLEILLHANTFAHTKTLDGLYWTLLYRFKHFAKIAGFQLSLETFALMKKDLSTLQLALWKLPERDMFITSKEEFLKQLIFETEVRARAWHAGLITDMMPVIA